MSLNGVYFNHVGVLSVDATTNFQVKIISRNLRVSISIDIGYFKILSPDILMTVLIRKKENATRKSRRSILLFDRHTSLISSLDRPSQLSGTGTAVRILLFHRRSDDLLGDFFVDTFSIIILKCFFDKPVLSGMK